MKRELELESPESEEHTKRIKTNDDTEQIEAKQEQPLEVKIEEDEDDNLPFQPQKARGIVKKGSECPYLDTVSRQVGDVTFKPSVFLGWLLICATVCRSFWILILRSAVQYLCLP